MAAVASRECYIGIQNKQYAVANFLQLYCLDHFAVSPSPAQSDIYKCMLWRRYMYNPNQPIRLCPIGKGLYWILNYKNDIQRALDFSKFERLFNQIMNKEAECFTAHLLNTTENATAFWLSNV